MILRRSLALGSLIPGLLSFGIAAAQVSASAGQTAAPAIPRTLNVPDGALIAAGPAPELDLLYTGDVIGFIEDCGCHLNPAGGLTRRAWVVNQLKANYPATPLVLLDTGNFSDNPTEVGDLRTATLLQSMQTLGYKAINIGERDLNLGYDDFMKRTDGLKMAFLSTNIVKQGTKDPVFSPYTIVQVKGASGRPVRIGVLGVDRYSPVWQKAGPDGTNLAMAAPADMIATYLPEVRAKSDVVVLLAALSKEDAHDLAKRFTDLDLILGAYGGIYSTVEENEGRVGIYYTGNQGKRLGESRITLDANRRVAEVKTYLHFLTLNYPEDKAMQDAIADVVAKTRPQKPADVKKSAVVLNPVINAPAADGH
jgi:2',3'-cyclic-nucleotide 2'-phosphodiesterase (5'-nucleotidase family)